MRDTVEAIVSAGGLHWIGDIVGSLTQVKHLLKPDGVFVGAVIGGDSLFELRSVDSYVRPRLSAVTDESVGHHCSSRSKRDEAELQIEYHQ